MDDILQRIQDLENNQTKVTELLNQLISRYDNIVHKLDLIESLDKGNLATLEADLSDLSKEVKHLSKEVKEIYQIATTGSSGFRMLLALGSFIASLLSAVTLWLVIGK